jgi:hypothetical protein
MQEIEAFSEIKTFKNLILYFFSLIEINFYNVIRSIDHFSQAVNEAK